MKKIVLLVVAVCLLLSMAGCCCIALEPKCENGCGNKADPECMADMCDDCCNYFCGLNGCYRDHRG